MRSRRRTRQATPAARTDADLPYLSPDSIYWEYLGDWGNLAFGPRLLLLQVAHPAVGAAVADHSTYKADPYGRLVRTLRSLMTYVYGTRAEAEAESARLAELHVAIKGADDQGRRYSGRDPQAMLWVHATFLEPFLTLAGTFFEPIEPDRLQQGFEDWRQIGRMLGLRDRDMPATIAEFEAYWDDMVATTLEDNASVQDILHWTFTEMKPPFVGRLPEPLWRRPWNLPVRMVHTLTVGSIPPELRERFGETWSPRQQKVYDRVATGTRIYRRVVPDTVRYMPIAASAVRRERRRSRTERRGLRGSRVRAA